MIKLHITDREGFSKGYVAARAGMVTRQGVISRVSAKSVWTINDSGDERLHRYMDGRLPTLRQADARKSDMVL